MQNQPIPNAAAAAPTPELDLSTAEDVACEECTNTTFSEVIVIKKLAAIMSPNGQEIMAPIKTFQCAKCGHLNADFIPKVDKPFMRGGEGCQG